MDVFLTGVCQIVGPITDVIYLILSLIFTKEIKNKKKRLTFFIAIAYVCCVMLSRFVPLLYILFIPIIFGILKLLYKEKVNINDIFVISLASFYLSFLSALVVFIDKEYFNYYFVFLINRILLFLPLLFKTKLAKMYQNYCMLWNRNKKEKKPVKSITLRNITLIVTNVFIFLLNAFVIIIVSWK